MNNINDVPLRNIFYSEQKQQPTQSTSSVVSEIFSVFFQPDSNKPPSLKQQITVFKTVPFIKGIDVFAVGGSSIVREDSERLNKDFLGLSKICARGDLDKLKRLFLINPNYLKRLFLLQCQKNLPILLACFHGHVEILKFLQRKYGDEFLKLIKVVNSRGAGIFHYASISNDLDVLKFLCSIDKYEKLSDWISKRSIYQETPLHLACGKYGNLESVKFMREMDSKTFERSLEQLKDVDGRTPLYYLCSRSQKDIFNYLSKTCPNVFNKFKLQEKFYTAGPLKARFKNRK